MFYAFVNMSLIPYLLSEVLAKLGSIVSKWPLCFLFFSIFVSLVGICGFFNLKYIDSNEELFVPQDAIGLEVRIMTIKYVVFISVTV